MRRKAAERRNRRLLQLARWFETFWWCRCSYSNIATYRCYACGARPPRHLRAEVGGVPQRKKRTVETDVPANVS